MASASDSTVTQQTVGPTDAAASISSARLPNHTHLLPQVKHLDLQQLITAQCFFYPTDKIPNHPPERNLPPERYITIILQGYKHFGVCTAWMDKMQSTQKFKPSRKPHEYLKVGEAGGLAHGVLVWQQGIRQMHRV